jgi:hypothetical protein
MRGLREPEFPSEARMEISEQERPVSDEGLPARDAAPISSATGTEYPFGPPAPKPIPLWVFVGAAMALVLFANLIHGPSSPEAPVARRSMAATRSLADPRTLVPQSANSLFEQQLGISAMGTVGLAEYEQELLARAGARNGSQGPGYAMAPTRIGTPATGESSPCAALERDIQALDAAARSARSAYQQDVLRAARSRARSKQLALGC